MLAALPLPNHVRRAAFQTDISECHSFHFVFPNKHFRSVTIFLFSTYSSPCSLHHLSKTKILEVSQFSSHLYIPVPVLMIWASSFYHLCCQFLLSNLKFLFSVIWFYLKANILEVSHSSPCSSSFELLSSSLSAFKSEVWGNGKVNLFFRCSCLFRLWLLFICIPSRSSN